jgi:ribosomal-protein-serine acetyltransferase
MSFTYPEYMNPIVVDQELELRPLAHKDAPTLFALTDTNRAHLREWLPWLDSIRVASDTAGFIDKTLQTYEQTRTYTAGIWWRERLVGVIGHNHIDWDNRITHPGYWLASDCQGHGIATRCCRALIQHAFDSLDLNRIEVCTAVGNHRSSSVTKRLGFTHEGVRREGEWLYDRFVDLNVHAMLRSTWQLRTAIATK